MTISTENRIQLYDGFSLGYAEYGDPQGKPILYFHGMPSSRFELFTPQTNEISTRLGAHVIVLERPGVGLSDFKPYTIASWPDLVVRFADAMHLERFSVLGLSSGGKYVAACAWKIPSRLESAGIISGNTLYTLPGARATLSGQDKLLYFLADKLPWLLRFFLGMIARNVRKDPGKIFDLFSDLSEVDKAALSRPDVQLLLNKMVAGAFQQGTRGVALDWKLEARPWGFPLQDIRMPVYVWHGGQDRLVPTEQGRITAAAIPNSQLKIFPDDGHISMLVNHYEEILGTIIHS